MVGGSFSKVGWGTAELEAENCHKSAEIVIFGTLLSDGHDTVYRVAHHAVQNLPLTSISQLRTTYMTTTELLSCTTTSTGGFEQPDGSSCTWKQCWPSESSDKHVNCSSKQGMDLIDLWQIFREMAGVIFWPQRPLQVQPPKSCVLPLSA